MELEGYLKKAEDIIPDEYDGSYELVREVVRAYKKVNASELDELDLRCIYFMVLGTWVCSFERKIGIIRQSHILSEDKERLANLISAIKGKSYSRSLEYGRETKDFCCGMFGTGFNVFRTDNESVARFVTSCAKLVDENDEETIYSLAEEPLSVKLKGMGMAALSEILHCIHPTVFPILNSGDGDVYKKLGVDIKHKNDTTCYIENCRKIKAYRDANFKFKNYRVFDAMWELKNNEENYMEADYYNTILHGAPGTGKTYYARNIAANWVSEGSEYQELTEEQKSQIAFVQFHPSYDYTDFVEGIRPVKVAGNIGFERRDGIFKEFCKKAIDSPDDYFVFIIDEINRGDISKIFGELFYSIEDSYRGEGGRVKTQYQNLVEEDDVFYQGFYVPENVIIIGTMNDIDRSVESLDFAMRRRFAFVEVTAEKSAQSMGIDYSKDSPMRRLNDAIEQELGRDYQIGGAYFLGCNLDDEEEMEGLWTGRLESLLREYLRGKRDAAQKLVVFENAFYGVEDNG